MSVDDFMGGGFMDDDKVIALNVARVFQFWIIFQDDGDGEDGSEDGDASEGNFSDVDDLEGEAQLFIKTFKQVYFF